MELKIISFNIRCANDPDGHSVEERAPRVGAILRDYAPDIVGMQEYRQKWEAQWDAVANSDYEEMKVDRGDGEGLVLSWRRDKFQTLQTGHFWFADDPQTPSADWDEKYHKPRICAYAVMKEKETGTVFTYMNVHFGFGAEGHIKSARLLYDYAQKLGKYPTVIAGDFNMTTDTPGYNAMTGYFTDVNAATDRLKAPTFHNYGRGAGRIIDYCFVSGSVMPVSYEIITRTFDGKYPSDHYGICMNLKV